MVNVLIKNRYIYIYNIKMKNLCRDRELKFIKTLDASIYDLRIADNHIEIAAYNEINNRIMLLFKEKYYKINVNSNNIKSLDYAIYLISEQRYWEAHDVLENIWHEQYGIMKKTYQFIILLCVANIHKQRGHIKTYKNVISRAMKIDTINKIENIDITKLKNKFIANENYKMDNYFKHIMS